MKKYAIKLENGNIKEIPNKIYSNYERFIDGKSQQLIPTWHDDIRNDISSHFNIKKNSFDFIKR